MHLYSNNIDRYDFEDSEILDFSFDKDNKKLTLKLLFWNYKQKGFRKNDSESSIIILTFYDVENYKRTSKHKFEFNKESIIEIEGQNNEINITCERFITWDNEEIFNITFKSSRFTLELTDEVIE
jgi:hypothetical protein